MLNLFSTLLEYEEANARTIEEGRKDLLFVNFTINISNILKQLKLIQINLEPEIQVILKLQPNQTVSIYDYFKFFHEKSISKNEQAHHTRGPIPTVVNDIETCQLFEKLGIQTQVFEDLFNKSNVSRNSFCKILCYFFFCCDFSCCRGSKYGKSKNGMNQSKDILFGDLV